MKNQKRAEMSRLELDTLHGHLKSNRVTYLDITRSLKVKSSDIFGLPISD